MIIDRDIKYKNEEKKLKKYPFELDRLYRILAHIKCIESYQELITHPVSKLYGFEALRNVLSGYYSFRLSKSGIIRLICTFSSDKKLVLVFISMDHYEDYKKKLK